MIILPAVHSNRIFIGYKRRLEGDGIYHIRILWYIISVKLPVGGHGYGVIRADPDKIIFKVYDAVKISELPVTV